MTGAWLASYVALWVVVACMAALHVGTLRQIGLIQLRARPAQDRRVPTPEEDGPRIGDRLPEFGRPIDNGYDGQAIRRPEPGVQTLVMSMSALCEGCQDLVAPLNDLAAARGASLQLVAIMRGDEGPCRSFLGIFPLHMPVYFDPDHALANSLNLHQSPFGLLYDDRGRLVRKGMATNSDDLAALLGDMSAPPEALASVYPPLDIRASAHQETAPQGGL